MKCCLPHRTWLLPSETDWSFGYLDKSKPTISVNIPASSANWTQWNTLKREKDVKVGKECVEEFVVVGRQVPSG